MFPVELSKINDFPIHVSRREERPHDAYRFRTVIEPDGNDRGARSHRDVIEPGPPFVHEFSRSFRRERQNPAVVGVERFDLDRDSVLTHYALHWDPTEPAHYPADGRAEERMFRKESEANAKREQADDAEWKIPVGRVGRDDDNHLRKVWQLALNFPAEGAQDQTTGAAGEAIPARWDRCWQI